MSTKTAGGGLIAGGALIMLGMFVVGKQRESFDEIEKLGEGAIRGCGPGPTMT